MDQALAEEQKENEAKLKQAVLPSAKPSRIGVAKKKKKGHGRGVGSTLTEETAKASEAATANKE